MELGSEHASRGQPIGYDPRPTQRRDAVGAAPQVAADADSTAPPATPPLWTNATTVFKAVLGDGSDARDPAQPSSPVVANAPGQRESDPLTPRLAKVSIGIPDSYFRQIWQKHFDGEANGTPAAPYAATLDRIRVEESTKIQRHVAQLLPSAEGVRNPMELVTVTSFDDLPVKELPRPTWDQNAWAWLKQYGGMLALVGLALASLFVLRSMARAGAVEARSASLSTRVTLTTDLPAAGEEPIESLPFRRASRAGPVCATSREELSELVGQDPHAAAGILRTWVGNSG